MHLQAPRQPDPPRPGADPAPRHGVWALSLGRPFGVPVLVGPAWFVYSALLAGTVFAPLLRSRVEAAGPTVAALGASACAVGLGLSVLAHELAHCVAAQAVGVRVLRLRLLVIGGLTETDGDGGTPGRDGLVALAGPLVSTALAGILVALGRIPAGAPGPRMAVESCLLLGVLNVLLAGFNLLPAAPLDGGRITTAALWAITGNRARATRLASAAGLLLALVIGAYGLSMLVISRDTLEVSGAVVTLLVALFLFGGARQGLARAALLELVPRLDVRRLLRPALLVPEDVPLAEALRRAEGADRPTVVSVGPDGAPRGLLAARLLAQTPEPRRPWVSLASVTRPLEPGLVIDAGLRGEAVLEALRQTPASEYLVLDGGGAVAGVLAVADIAALVGPSRRRRAGGTGPAR